MNVNIMQVTTKDEKQHVFQVRKTVFVDEQQVPIEMEIDEHEADAIHFLCTENGKAVGASRLRFVGAYGKLERISVLKDFRGRSYGKKIIEAMEKRIITEGYQKAKLNAQTHAIDFYEKLDYKVISDEFMDAGIPHVTMIKVLK
jgi:predicted GNAT family N-acyltransferase